MYSQNGEDIVLENLFEKMKIDKGFFVDVGAWNGIHLSNTYWALLKGWEGIEIEGNKKYVDGMYKNFGTLIPSQIRIHEGYIKANELDDILQNMRGVPHDFDLLSIDIDTYDYWVWKYLTKYSPKVVIIESNSREGIVIQEPNTPQKIGASPQALRELAVEKGYTEYTAVEGNLIFVRKDLYDNVA